MAELKTKATEVSVEAFLDTVEDPRRREDGKALAALLERVTGEPAKMWGPSIVGFGSYHYTYDSGHSGEMCRIGFSPRKAQLVLYGLRAGDDAEAMLARLGKHSTGKGCLYVKKLADVDMGVLEAMARASLKEMQRRYPD